MRHLIFPAAFAGLVIPIPAAAQAGPASDVGSDIAPLVEKMRDPESQRDTALMLRAMTEILLDMPIAPLAEAAAEMAGEEAESIDPDLTLRKLAPGAGRLGADIERELPRAMDAVGGMAEGLAAMAPLLQDLASRMRESLPPAE